MRHGVSFVRIGVVAVIAVAAFGCGGTSAGGDSVGPGGDVGDLPVVEDVPASDPGTSPDVLPAHCVTGEISLRGRVMRVGGIKEKVLAASRFGIKQVILPDQNRADWSEVPEEVRHKLGVHFIRHIAELLPLALREK